MTTDDSRYLALWTRMQRVVEGYTRAQRLKEADYCMIDFFASFEDIDELEHHVKIAEETARVEKVL